MMASVSRAARAAAEAWSVVQVELHGRYSLERMRMFHEYSARAKWTRIICWCIFTPIPCLLVNIVLDVAPLAKPSAGRDANYVYWARGTISALVCIYAIFMHIKFLAPNLGMTHWHLSCITLVVTISCTTFDYILAGFIPMPIPFQLVTASPVFMVAFTVIFSLLFGRKLRNNVAVHSSTIRAMAVITVQLSLTFVYPIFMYGFNSIPATYQTPYMIFIPMIKIIAKNVMSKFVLSSDIKPEVLVFCIDVFNAVFNSVAMQHSTTISTSLLVMLIDISQGCISVYDVYLEVLPLKRFMARMPPGHPLCGKNILEVAMALNQKNKRKGSSRAHGLQGQQMNEIDTMIHSSTAEPPASLSLVEAFKSVRVLPLEQPSHSEFAAVTPSKISALRSKDREMFLSSTRKLLFTTEFITLIEYSEVIMPAFYSLFIAGTYYLPNRAFYPIVAHIDSQELKSMVTSTLLYAVLELLSLLILVLLLRRITGMSAMVQVGFVLETQSVMIQSMFLSWVFYGLQNSLEHLGADFSFQFKWLKSNEGS